MVLITIIVFIICCWLLMATGRINNHFFYSVSCSICIAMVFASGAWVSIEVIKALP